jgi:TonB family protein
MRSWWHSILVVVAVSSCASAPEPKSDGGKLDPGWRPGSTRLPGSEDDDGLKLEQAKGALDQRDVDKVLDRQVQSLVPCYEQAGAAQRYASGDVRLRFFVTSSGEVSNVLVVASAVGNFDVERCLITEGRKLKFPPPQGSHATDFEYSLRFQASGEGKVVQWEDGALTKNVAHLTPQLAPCGSLGPKPVRAVVYIQPGGAVSSVGLACPSPIDMTASACAVEQIRKWHLPGDRKHIVRASFVVASAAASAPAAHARAGKRTRRRG